MVPLQLPDYDYARKNANTGSHYGRPVGKSDPNDPVPCLIRSSGLFLRLNINTWARPENLAVFVFARQLPKRSFLSCSAIHVNSKHTTALFFFFHYRPIHYSKNYFKLL